MITIEITEEANTYDAMSYILRQIAKLIDEGYRSGYYPNWQLKEDGEKEVDDEKHG